MDKEHAKISRDEIFAIETDYPEGDIGLVFGPLIEGFDPDKWYIISSDKYGNRTIREDERNKNTRN